MKPAIREIVQDGGKGKIIAAIVDEQIGTVLLTGPDAVLAFQEMIDASTAPQVFKHLRPSRNP